MNTDQYIVKWLNGTLTEEERAQFEESETFKELKKLSDSVQYFKAPDFDTKEELIRLNKNKAKGGRQIKINW